MFINNTAVDFGGAIYIHTLPIILFERPPINTGITIYTNYELYEKQCFYSISDSSHVTFSENKARFGGLDIYGATQYTEDCSFINQPFNFGNASIPLNKYQISSDPTRVCFCINNIPQCENRTYIILNETRYPGETFTTYMVLTGYNFGRVPGTVYTNVLSGDYKESNQ